MPLIVHTLILLLAAALSIPFARLARIPLPLLQVGVGVLLEPLGVQVRLDSDTFMLLFIPPLLFSDAVHIPKREFFELKRIILALALGLVVFTTLAGGWASHALLPTVPLAACMALAAILSPTDTVAVTGMIGTNAPRRIVHVLEGEALLNDASGLVCFKFAAAAATTGAFSLPWALQDFGWLASIGLATGAGVAAGFGLVDRALIRMGIDDVVTQTALTVLLPFAVYLLADALGGSGILAAVAAGLVIGRLRILGQARGVVRLQIASLWRTITVVFNGLIFLLLGLQLPSIAASGLAAATRAGLSPWGLLGVTLGITVALTLLRLVWLTALVFARMAWDAVWRRRLAWPGWAAMAAIAVGGVRGAVTLAGILSLPVATGEHGGFPDRELLVVLAAGVIITSLLMASALLPWLMGRASLGGLHPVTIEANRVRGRLAEAVIVDLKQAVQSGQATGEQGLRAEVSAMLLAEQTRRLDELTSEGEARGRALTRARLEAAARLRVVRTERDELHRLCRFEEVADDVEALIAEDLDREEVAIARVASALPRETASE